MTNFLAKKKKNQTDKTRYLTKHMCEILEYAILCVILLNLDLSQIAEEHRKGHNQINFLKPFLVKIRIIFIGTLKYQEIQMPKERVV